MKAVPDLSLYWPETEYPCFWVLEAKGASAHSRSLRRDPRLYPSSVLLFADYWAAINGNIAPQLRDAPSQLLTLNYENLIRQPQDEVRRITEFCGLAPMAAMPLEIEKDRNSLRRDLLTDADVAVIRERVRAVASRFGYAAAAT